MNRIHTPHTPVAIRASRGWPHGPRSAHSGRTTKMPLLELAPPTRPMPEEHPGTLLLPSREPAAAEEILIYRDDHTDFQWVHIDSIADAEHLVRDRTPRNPWITIVRETNRNAETGSLRATAATTPPQTATSAHEPRQRDNDDQCWYRRASPVEYHHVDSTDDGVAFGRGIGATHTPVTSAGRVGAGRSAFRGSRAAASHAAWSSGPRSSQTNSSARPPDAAASFERLSRFINSTFTAAVISPGVAAGNTEDMTTVSRPRSASSAGGYADRALSPRLNSFPRSGSRVTASSMDGSVESAART